MAYFPEFRPMRSFILQNLRSDNDRPKFLRWLCKPFFEPYKDFVGIFILDRPDSDHLQQWRGYVTTR